MFVDNEYFEVNVDPVGGPPVVNIAHQSMAMAGAPIAAPAAIPAAASAAPAAPAAAPKAAAAAAASGTPLKAPMPGMIVHYEKNVGDAVAKGDTVVILEAMKMENALPAPCDGTILAINYKSGDNVTKGDVLCAIG